MKQTIPIVFESELYSVMSYYQRLFTVCDQIEKLALTPNIKKISANLYDSLYEWMEESALSPMIKLDTQSLMILNSPKIFFKTYDFATTLSELLITLHKLPTNNKVVAQQTAIFINKLLQHCFEFHSVIHTLGNTVIEYPRSALLRCEKNENELLCFQIDEQKLDELLNREVDNLNSIQDQRDKKYAHYLQLGHESIFHKKPEKALEYFQRAAIYNNSAEVLTLIGWACAQLGKLEKAKQSCLEAIKVDEKYGAAYNDLGSYLLSEQRIEEALKWFEVAKSAPHYQNREYPYINVSKIYISLKKYDKALKELEQAYKIAPYHEELESMIVKIKQLLNSDKNPEPPKPRFKPTLV